MLDGMFKSGGMEALKQDLDATWRTHREVTQNLANVDTPGFVARDTDFRSQLVGGANGESPAPDTKGFAMFQEDQVRAEVGLGAVKQGVNVEKEMARLSKATLEQASVVKLLSTRYQTLLTAIREGK